MTAPAETKQFALTEKQAQAWQVIAGDATHVMLFGGSRCVAGDTILDGHHKNIAELAAEGLPVEVMTTTGKVIAEPPFLKGKCKLLTLTLESGKNVSVTPDHRFWDGSRWVEAKDLQIGSSVAVQLSEPSPLSSNSAPFLSRYVSNVQRLMGRPLSLKSRCSVYFRQCDRQPLLSLIFDQGGRALIFGVQGHIQQIRSRFFPFWQQLVSDIRTHSPQALSGGCSQNDQELSHFSSLDACLPTYQLWLKICSVYGRIYEQSRYSHLARLQSLKHFSLQRSFLKVKGVFSFLSFRFLGLSCDTPLRGCYSLENVSIITETAEQSYYTLHVPVVEHYFANGILHHNSGKTFLLVRAVIMRAIKAPESRHAILRFRFNHVKQSVVLDTFPKVMRLCFPGVKYTISKTDWYATLENGSEIWFGGLDDKERAEKILGMEFVTIYLNESSQIPQSSRDIVVTRLAQQVAQKITGRPPVPLRPRMLYDCNPPKKSHWTYKLFVKHVDPSSGKTQTNPEDFVSFKINPKDNECNLSAGYISTLEGLSAALRKRFLLGEFGDDTENGLFDETSIDKWRVVDADELPEMVRIVIAVDPSGSGDVDNADNDSIGIAACGLGVDGIGYVLADLTVKAGPATWGRIVTDAYDRYEANTVVGETNYGGEMVKFVIQTARPRTPYKAVTATRNKQVRAEPVAALYEQGKIRHVGYLTALEDELSNMTTNGYVGTGSPNRADAVVWGFTELFMAIVAEKKQTRRSAPAPNWRAF